MYSIEIKPSCQRDIEKLCKKNPILREVLEKKMNEITENPQHYKPLKYDLAGERRVHIIKKSLTIFVGFLDAQECNFTKAFLT